MTESRRDGDGPLNGSRPAVSVVLPTYNRASLLPDVLEDLRRQTFEDFEVVVVDDGSDDGTERMFREDDRGGIRYVRHETNRGASAARNTGIQKARGRYIAFQDSDDRWRPQKLEKQVAVMQEAPERVGLVYTGTEMADPDGNVVPIQVPRHRGDVHEQQLYRDHLSGTPTWLVRRACFEDVGTFNEDLPARMDYEFNLRLTRRYHVEFVKEPLVRIGQSADNRITDRGHPRIEAHRTIIDEQIRPEVQSMNLLKRRRILGSQFFTLGRFCQRHGLYGEAARYLARSLQHNPVRLKAWGAYLLALGGRDVGRFYYDWRAERREREWES